MSYYQISNLADLAGDYLVKRGNMELLGTNGLPWQPMGVGGGVDVPPPAWKAKV